MAKKLLKEKKEDHILIREILAGGNEKSRAENELFEKYESYSLAMLMSRFGLQKEEAQEIFMNAITDALMAIYRGKFRAESSFNTYYTGILKNKKNDFLRAKNRLNHTNLEDRSTLDGRIKDNPEAEFSDGETFNLVVKIFAKLAKKAIPSLTNYTTTIKSTVFEEVECLKFYKMQADGFRWEVIATRLGMTEAAAKQKEARCFERLKKALVKNHPKEFQILSRSYTRKKLKND